LEGEEEKKKGKTVEGELKGKRRKK